MTSRVTQSARYTGQPEPDHAGRTQIGLVLADQMHDALALDERRIGSLHLGRHDNSNRATAGPNRRAMRTIACDKPHLSPRVEKFL